ncbi:Hypothetical protein NocV09_01101780 [Nannochloropsis oceanica]
MTVSPTTLAVASSPEAAGVPRPDDDEPSLPQETSKTPLSNSTSDIPRPLIATVVAAAAEEASHGSDDTSTASVAVDAPTPLSPLSPSAAAWGRPLHPLPAQVKVNVNPALTTQLQNMALISNTSSKSAKGQKGRESPGDTPTSGTHKDKDTSKPHEQQEQQGTTSPTVPAPAAVMAQSSPDNETKKSQAMDESKSTLKAMDLPAVVVEEEEAGKEEKEISTLKSATMQRDQHDAATKKEGTNRRELMDNNVPLPLTGDESPSPPAQQPPMQAQQCKQEQEHLKKQESAASEQAFPVVSERGATEQAQQQQQQKQKHEGIEMTVSMNAPSTAVMVQQPWEATKQKRQKRRSLGKQEFDNLEQIPTPSLEGGPSKQVQQQQPNALVQHQHHHHNGQQHEEKGGTESQQPLLTAGERHPPTQHQQPQQQERESIAMQYIGSTAGQRQQERQGKEQQNQLPPAPAPPSTSLPRNLVPGLTIALAHQPSAPLVERVRTHLAALERSGTVVMECLPVPLALAEWTNTHAYELNNILTQTRERSNVLSIILETLEGDAGQDGGKKSSGSKSGKVLVITAMSTEEAHRAKTLLELHLKNQQELLRTERRLQQVQNEFLVVEEEVAAGLRIEFGIRKELGRVVVGKKGERVKRVLAETGVSSINVGDDGMIRVVGPTVATVMKARELLELVQEDVQVPLEAVAWFSRAVLDNLKKKSGCVILRTDKVGTYVQQQQQQEASESRKVTVVRIVGTHKQVEIARLLVDTQIEYGGRHQALRSSKEQMLQMLKHAGASYSNKSGSRRLQLEQQKLRPQQQPRFQTDALLHTGSGKGRSIAHRGGGGEKAAETLGVRPQKQQQQQQQRKPLSAFEAASVQESSSSDMLPSASRTRGRGKAARISSKNGGASGDDATSASAAMAPSLPAKNEDNRTT